MPAKRVTLKEIAERTGYTVNTVSRALKDQPVLSQSTRKLIQQTAREMGYIPNRAATGLRLGYTHVIALIAGNLFNPFFGMLYEHVRAAARSAGYTVMLFTSDENVQSELEAIQTAISFGVDGLILVPCQKSDEPIALLTASALPFVLLAREYPKQEADTVLYEEKLGGELAVRHLLAHGRRELAYISDISQQVYSINQRREGALCAAAEAGVRLHMMKGSRDAKSLAAELSTLHKEAGVAGVICFCDSQARGLIPQLRLLDIAVPGALGVIGFDNIDDIAPSPLPLCSVGADYAAMCLSAVELLDSRVKGDRSQPKRIVFPAQVFCRMSCATL